MINMVIKVIVFMLFSVCNSLFAQPNKEDSIHQVVRGLLSDSNKEIKGKDHLILIEQKLDDEHRTNQQKNDTILVQYLTLNTSSEEKLNCEKELENQKQFYLNMPQLTSVKSTTWALQNLTENELYYYFGLTQIKEAGTDEEWKNAHHSATPAFCYHKLDHNRKNGILLNVHAIKLLGEKLKNQSDFRFPVKSDFDALNSVAKSMKHSPLKVFASAKGLIKWEIKSEDFFNFNLPPLSYRRNISSNEWQGMNSAGIFCYDTTDQTLSKGIIIAEISVSDPNWYYLPKMSVNKEDEYSNIGVYVRLIYVDNKKKPNKLIISL